MGGEVEHLLAIARKARREILGAGEGGEAIAARAEQVREALLEMDQEEAAGADQGLEVAAGELGGEEEQPMVAGNASEDQQTTDREDGEEEREDGDQVSSRL